MVNYEKKIYIHSFNINDLLDFYVYGYEKNSDFIFPSSRIPYMEFIK